MIDQLIDEIGQIKRRLRDLESQEEIAPACRVFRTSNRTIASGTASWVSVPFGSEGYDTRDMHGTTNTERIVIPVTGKYLIGAVIKWDANATGDRWLALRVDGTTIIAAHKHTAKGVDMSLVVARRLTAAQYVEMVVMQDSGGGLALLYADDAPSFWAHKVG